MNELLEKRAALQKKIDKQQGKLRRTELKILQSHTISGDVAMYQKLLMTDDVYWNIVRSLLREEVRNKFKVGTVCSVMSWNLDELTCDIKVFGFEDGISSPAYYNEMLHLNMIRNVPLATVDVMRIAYIEREGR